MLPESQRLYLREINENDHNDLFRLYSNHEVMNRLGREAFKDKVEIFPVIETITSYYKKYPGYGVWAAIEKKSEMFMGWYCLKSLDHTEEIELGYRLLPEFWGKGYATEMSKKILAYGFNHMLLDIIVGITSPENKASQNVLLKTGMTYKKQAYFYNTAVNYYSVSKKEFMHR